MRNVEDVRSWQAEVIKLSECLVKALLRPALRVAWNWAVVDDISPAVQMGNEELVVRSALTGSWILPVAELMAVAVQDQRGAAVQHLDDCSHDLRTFSEADGLLASIDHRPQIERVHRNAVRNPLLLHELGDGPQLLRVGHRTDVFNSNECPMSAR